MASLVKLHVGVVLKHVLDLEPVLLEDYDDSEEDEDENEEAEEEIEESEELDEVGFVSAPNGLLDLTRGPDAINRRRGFSEGAMILNGGPRIKNVPPAPGKGKLVPVRPMTAESGISNLALDFKSGVARKSQRNSALKSAKQAKKQSKGDNSSNKRKAKQKHHKRGKDPFGADLLDFTGPKLIHGVKAFLLFHQILGQLNWIGLPLWCSILYKLLVISLAYYVSVYRLGMSVYTMNLINENYKNPIFIFISAVAIITCISQISVTFKTNLYDLCPMYKILTTPKLCFIKTEVQHLLGSQSLGLILMFLVYNGLLMNLVMHSNLEDFVNTFSFPLFVADIIAWAVLIFTFVGTAMIDLYIRSAFGHWLLALKSHLENRFMHFHRRQKRQRHSGQQQSSAQMPGSANFFAGGTSIGTTTLDSLSFSSGKSLERPFNFITLDEIQRNLNNMDDHLEVLRSVQVGCLVHISLNAFLANGALFLLAYHLLANQSNFYHGFVMLLVSVNFILIIFVCYSGDRWVYYALSSFVQTVEDEYFMQNDMKTIGSNPLDGADMGPAAISPSPSTFDPVALSAGPASDHQAAAHQLLLIRKKDVLFCREFLHQFENHLATPWSKLTVKSHLHMLRTFVTLIAAQIIFDHEH